ncbi:hypothetical protein pdam_00012804 [Pocillopora damicornis]|uniref:CUB domain-containing protein n=1 Tax=Pocillopora damicornis TaxID=46731 RepID=A0A3M6T8B7_POCDA|nr:hypothetical protein pdam_00012804 [Pocillopora damicornis]
MEGVCNREAQMYSQQALYHSINAAVYPFAMNVDHKALLLNIFAELNDKYLLEACASPEVINGTSGLFSSFNYSAETPRNSICFWNITVPEGFVVKITFHAFSLSPADTKTDCSNAQGARLRISDVASTEQARNPFELCGQSIPSPVYTSTNSIQVRLKTVAQHGVIGFNASYEAISPDIYYPDNQSCTWDIVASNGKHLKLEIEKTTKIQQCNQCNCDYLDVQYGFDSSGNPSGKICKELTETVTYYSLKDRLRKHCTCKSDSKLQTLPDLVVNQM